MTKCSRPSRRHGIAEDLLIHWFRTQSDLTVALLEASERGSNRACSRLRSGVEGTA
jgi:hypothetical protein